jgi:hypothetical protein
VVRVEFPGVFGDEGRAHVLAARQCCLNGITAVPRLEA